MLLSQTVIPSQLISPGSPVESAAVTLPALCASCRVVATIDPADLASPKELTLEGFLSKDGGLTWLPSDGFTWRGPNQASDKGISPPGLVRDCTGYAGALVKGRLSSPTGITASLALEVD